MKPTNKQFSRDPWNFDLNVKLEAKGQIYNSPNYVDTFIWKELPKEEYDKYNAVKTIKREEARQERAQQNDLSAKQKSLMQKRLALIKLCLKYGIKGTEISTASGMSSPAISRITHSSKELIDNSTDDI
jgi:phosphoserine aminotransferase